MNRRAAGVSFCFIATILYVSRYFIVTSGVVSYADVPLKSALVRLGDYDILLILSIASLIIGVIYIIVGEVKKEK
ncbi:hypothetical protein MF628_000796 [Paenibacillus polymyxa]|uniref:hypothetical protein n=1 Tax=Paenibacillus polymyxa TaxID=1406 RepID=UPI002025A4E2|nr:hypothetical protein [Paenibacillus polymyxa]URJ46278.1 hypothetical protein MF628_000796 [Paenibacillus polymyxa]